MDLSVWTRTHQFSCPSEDIARPIPSLQSPSGYHESVTKFAKATLKQKRMSDRLVDMPPLFPGGVDTGDHVHFDTRRWGLVETTPVHAPQASVRDDEESTKSAVNQQLKTASRPREPQDSPPTEDPEEIVSVFEIQSNMKVCTMNETTTPSRFKRNCSIDCVCSLQL